ncbi:hypothetical protein CRG98_000074, partial [Punica granatum]
MTATWGEQRPKVKRRCRGGPSRVSTSVEFHRRSVKPRVASQRRLQISGYKYGTSRWFLLVTVLFIGLFSHHLKRNPEAIFLFWLSCSKGAFSVSAFK